MSGPVTGEVVITHANDPCHEDEALVYVPGSHPNRVCVNIEELFEAEQQRLAELVRHYARERHELQQYAIDCEHQIAELMVDLENYAMAGEDAAWHLKRDHAEVVKRILEALHRVTSAAVP